MESKNIQIQIELNLNETLMTQSSSHMWQVLFMCEALSLGLKW